MPPCASAGIAKQKQSSVLHTRRRRFDPVIPGEEVPTECQKWFNSHYHFLLSGENTEETDFRKPIKPKTPKAKSKLNMALRRVRPNINNAPAAKASLSSVSCDHNSSEDENDDHGALAPGGVDYKLAVVGDCGVESESKHNVIQKGNYIVKNSFPFVSLKMSLFCI